MPLSQRNISITAQENH